MVQIFSSLVRETQSSFLVRAEDVEEMTEIAKVAKKVPRKLRRTHSRARQ